MIQTRQLLGLTAALVLFLAFAGVAGAQVFITPSPLPDGTIGIPYSVGIQTSIPLTNWSIPKGSLPAGLSIDANGNITGTPTALGTSNFTVQGQDPSSFLNYTQNYTLTIGPPLAITTPLTLPPVTVGGSYSVTLQAAHGLPPYTWFQSVPNLPPGLTLNISGILAGVPTTAGPYSFPITALDNGDPGQLATATFSLTVNPPPSGSGTLPNGFVGQPYVQSLPVTGGTGPFVWILTGGDLPPGLRLLSDGTLTGTPTTPGTYKLGMGVRDSYSILGGAAYSLTILAAGVSILTDVLPGGTVGQAYSQTLAAAGGKAPYQWTITDGALPGGLALDAASGLISGTPTTAGCLQREHPCDGRRRLGRQPLLQDHNRCGPAEHRDAFPAGWHLGLPYTQTLTAAGGIAPYSWSLDAARCRQV